MRSAASPLVAEDGKRGAENKEPLDQAVGGLVSRFWGCGIPLESGFEDSKSNHIVKDNMWHRVNNLSLSLYWT